MDACSKWPLWSDTGAPMIGPKKLSIIQQELRKAIDAGRDDSHRSRPVKNTDSLKELTRFAQDLRRRVEKRNRSGAKRRRQQGG